MASLDGVKLFTGYCMDKVKGRLELTPACTSKTVTVRCLIDLAYEKGMFWYYSDENNLPQSEVKEIVLRYYFEENKSQ